MRNSISLITTLCLSLIGVTNILAQPGIQWQESYGGSGNEPLFHATSTSDGGAILVGRTNSIDGDVESSDLVNNNAWVLKVDNTGVIQWSRALGGSGGDEGVWVIETSEGGYMIAGGSNSNDGDVSGNNGDNDGWIVKLDINGNILWQRSLGGTDYERIYSIKETTDGGYIIAGVTTSDDNDFSENNGANDCWVAKLDMNGIIQNQQLFGRPSNEGVVDILQADNNGYIFVANTVSNSGDVSGNHGSIDIWLVRLDASLNILWQKCLGGSNSENAHGITKSSDGGYIIAGHTSSSDGDVSSNNGSADFWIIKVDSNGTLEWENALGGSGIEFGNNVVELPGQGYLAGGMTQSNDLDVSGNHGGYDVWVVKLDLEGNLQWQKPLGGTGDEGVGEVMINDDGSILVATHSRSSDGDLSENKGELDWWVVKLGCPLEIVCLANISVPTDPGICGAVVNYLPPSQISACTDVNVLVTSGPESGQVFPVGTTTVSFLATDATGSTASCSFTVTVTSDLTADAGSDQVVIIDSGPGPDPYPCDTLEASASGGTPPYTYSWAPTTGLSDPNAANTDVCPTVTTTYTLTVTDANGCESTLQVTVSVIDIDDTGSLPLVGNNSNKVYVCHLATCETVEANIQANCNSPHSLCAHLSHGDVLGECTCKNGSGEGESNVHDLIPLLNAYPNPFTNTTTLTFSVKQDCRATLSVFDITGKEVARPFDGAAKKDKLHIATLDGTGLGSGIYFYTLKTDLGESFTKPLVLSQ